MDRVGIGFFCASLAVVLSGCPSEDKPEVVTVFDPYIDDLPAVPEYEDWYPETIDPPEGTEYSCKLVPLPEELKGLPNRDMAYINHVFAEIVTLCRANLRFQQQLGTAQQESGLEDYELAADKAVTTLEAEEVPQGLDDFHEDILAAIELQRMYFDKANKIYAEKVKPLIQEGITDAAIERERENAARDSAEIIERGAASAKLAGAWNKLFLRYSGHWDKTVEDSICLHLRAMDM